jgi:hypothetical protein
MPVGNLGPNFYPKLVEMTTALGMKPEDLISVMTSESGMNPAAYNPSGASGLIQFMPGTLNSVGFPGTPDQFRQLSGEEQLPWIQKLIKNRMRYQGGKAFTSGGQYYVANLWPVALKLPGVERGDPDTVILEKSPQSEGGYSKKYLDIGSKIKASDESGAYKANPLFDKEKKGYITLGDLSRQVNLNKNTPTYKQTLVSMQHATGYQPGTANKVPPSAVAQNDNSLEEILNKYIQMLSSASPISRKRLYKKVLPNHNILIKITAPDYASSVEFSRVLCTALDEDLLTTSYPHTDGQEVEVECCIAGPSQECFAAVEQMARALAETFKDATTKIGGITVKTKCSMNKKSSYQPISVRTAGTNYRKFLLKFV